MEGLNEIPASVYRVATKLESLQKLCHMDKVSVGHVAAAVHSVIGPQQLQDVGLNREEVTQTLNRMFHRVGHVTVAAAEETCGLMFRLYDRTQTGRVSAASLQTALIALSADNLLDKYRALISVSQNSSRSVSRAGLRALLQDLSQVPAAVQGQPVFGTVEAAVMSCINEVLTPMLSEEHVLSWLHSNPWLLLWLPALYRLSITQNIRHTVRCHTCKTFPITGLRYRCMKCVNVHVCQSCFLNDRQTRKHKTHHPVLEFFTQPTWRESLSSLVHSARYALLPRQHTRRNRRRVLMWVEPGEIENSGPPPSDGSTLLADSAVHHRPASARDVYKDASVRRPTSSSSSKALQTDEETLTQQTDSAALMNEVRNLHRDKWQLEEELQAWRLTVQSEHGLLGDRCSEMEVTMETLRQHHLCLQEMLTHALNKTEVQQHAKNVDMEKQQHTDDTRYGKEKQQHTDDTPHSEETETQQHTDKTPHSEETETQQHTDKTPHSEETETQQHTDNTPHREETETQQHTDKTPHSEETETQQHTDNTAHSEETETQQHTDNTPHSEETETQQHTDNMAHSEETETQHTDNTPHSEETEMQQHTDNTPHDEDMNTDRTTTPTSDILRNSEQVEDEEDQLQTPSPTIQWDRLLSHDLHWEEEAFTGDKCLCHPIGKEDEPKEVKLQGEGNCLSDEEEEEKDCGMCSPEKVLQETVDRLRAVMETSRCRERQTGERERAELLEAAEQVGDSIHHLVDTVRTNIL